MLIVRDLAHLPPHAQGMALAIGNFDGLHRGHRAVLSAMQASAAEQKIQSAVLTFTPHPRRFFAPDAPPLALEPFHVRMRRLRALGVDHMYLTRFTPELSQMTAEAFVTEILVARLRVRHVTTGENFVFGRGRSGDADFLARMAKQYEFGYHAVASQQVAGQEYASSHVRAALRAGEMAKAAEILGRPYELCGRVRHGENRGEALGYPTANIIPTGLLLPAFGVYAARYCVSEPLMPETTPQTWQPAVAYLGTRPTYGGERAWLEVHALDASENLYGKRLRVQLVAYVRPDATFASDAALQTQIAVDISQAKQHLEHINA
ncbi:MAG: bifunctional riboflavin kinase/FAD synthetase [Rickettsiales bacterium]|nr:bifunctional riboflavin kinase/FAD synthetase [Rickettsiales bacterium]